MCLSFLLLFPVFSQDTKENSDFRLASKLYEDKLFDLALEQFRQFYGAYPNSKQGTDARFYFGLCQLQLRKYEEARITFQNFAVAFPDHQRAPEAWWKSAEACIAMGLTREAALAFERVKTFHPRSQLAPGALLKAAEQFEQSGDRENARRLLRTITTDYASPEVVAPARLSLSEMYLGESQLELARSEAKRAIDATPDATLKARGYVLLAEALGRLGRITEAIQALGEVIRSYRGTASYFSALVRLGIIHREAGNMPEAIAAWKTVVDEQKAPINLRETALLETGDLYLFVSDYAKALNAFENAAQLHAKRTGEALYKAGLAAEYAEDPQQAFEYYRQALADTSGSTDIRQVYISCQRAAIAIKKYADALLLTEQYRERFPTDEYLAGVLTKGVAVCLYSQKNAQRAKNYADYVVEHFPTNPFIDEAFYLSIAADSALGINDGLEHKLSEFSSSYPASGYIPQARTLARYLELFALKHRETGFTNLALLMGDMIKEKSKGNLSFRLGEIFYRDLKDYERAAEQYADAIAAGLENQTELNAWYRIAKSYEYLAWLDELQKGGQRKRHALEAIRAYDSLLTKFPLNEYYEDAVLSRFRLRMRSVSTVTELKALTDELNDLQPPVGNKSAALLEVLSLYLEKSSAEYARLLITNIRKNPIPESLESEWLYKTYLVYLAVGERDSAYVALETLVSKQRGDLFSGLATRRLIQYYIETNRSLNARRLIDDLSSVYYYTPYAAEREKFRAQAAMQAKDYANAIAAYQRYLDGIQKDYFSLTPVSNEILYDLGFCYQQLKKSREARRYFSAFLLRDAASPRAGSVHFALGAMAREEKNLDVAAKHFQEASRLAGAQGQGIDRPALEAAELYFRSERYTDALTRFSQVAQQAKKDTALYLSIHSRIVICYLRLGNIKEAENRIKEFSKEFGLQPESSAEFEFEWGKYYMRKEDFETALLKFYLIGVGYRGMAIVPDAAFYAGRTYEFMQNTEMAMKVYDSILASFPNHPIIPRTQLTLGNLYYTLEQWDAAARLYKSVLENPQTTSDLVPFTMQNLIQAYKELQLYDAALQLTRQYIERFPDDPELMVHRIDIGVLFQKLGYYDQSIFHLQSLLDGANADDEAEIRYYTGESYYYKGEYQQAILEFLKIPYLVVKRTKADWASTAYYMAGQAYEKMSKFDQALTMYKQILTRPGVDPQFKTGAQREIDRVNNLLKTSGSEMRKQ